jgi:hypothetical protein
MIPTVDELLAFARTLKGKQLQTLHRRKPFKVAIISGALEIIASTGTPRATDRGHIGDLLARLKKTGSFQPGRYIDVTFNASYILALVKLWQEHHRPGVTI